MISINIGGKLDQARSKREDIHVLGGSIPVLLVAPDLWDGAVAVEHVGGLVAVY